MFVIIRLLYLDIMILQQWGYVLQQSFEDLLASTVNFLPNLLLAIIIFVVGWVIAVWVGWVIEEAIKALKVDHALRTAGFEPVVNRAGYKLNAGMFMGMLVKWFIILAFLIAALNALNLGQVTFFIQQIVSFLPSVIVAALIILVAAVVAEVVYGVVAGSARAAGIKAAGVAGTVARWTIWLFAILAALEQLQIAQGVLQTLFTGIVVALALAFGLAFGLGGQEAAARFLERTREDMQNKR